MKKITRNKYLLLLIILFGLLVSLLRINYNSVYYDEAFPIALGHILLQGEPCPGCYYMTGAVTIHSFAVAIGDSLGGLFGARMVNVLIGLGLTVILYLAARILFDDEKLGLITAAVFILSGQTLYLMKLATYDMIAAFFLGSTLLMIVLAEKVNSEHYRMLALFAAAVTLFFAAISKYLLPVFIPVLALYVLYRHGLRKSLIFFVIPVTALLVYYILFGAYPPREGTWSEIRSAREVTRIPLHVLFDWTIRWVTMAYLLAVFGMFHRKHGKTAILLILLSLPVITVHLVTRSEQSVNKNMIFTLVFLVPAAALGVDHLAHIFSMKRADFAVRTFYTFAVLVVFGSYGHKNLKWLERQYPDMSPVLAYFEENGFDGMTVGINTWGDSIYTYSLGARYPNARFLHISEVIETNDPGRYLHENVDFIVCEDGFYGKHCPCEKLGELLKKEYVLLEDFQIKLSWGETKAEIYGRK